MDIAMTAVGIMLAVTVAAVAVWTRAQKRRVDPQREILDFNAIVQRFYTGTDVTRADVERAYTRISETMGVPAGATASSSHDPDGSTTIRSTSSQINSHVMQHRRES
jgi:hypothetical protein